MFEGQTADYATSDALLLGRRTYDVFAAAWPNRGGDVPNADWMNNTRKFVASTTLESPKWQNTTVLKADVAAAVSRLKHGHGKTIMLNGSATLLRTLLEARLVDELRLFMHPIVVGSGRRLFEPGEHPLAFELVESHTYGNGVVSLVYQPAPK